MVGKDKDRNVVGQDKAGKRNNVGDEDPVPVIPART